MKKSILFIIPSLEIGGTISSLNSLYKELCEEYDISVFSLASTGKAPIFFKNKILPTLSLINYFSANYKDLNRNQKVLALTVKFIKRLCRCLKINIQSQICKHTMMCVEKNAQYDVVVGFQEGIATHVASYSNAKIKIAWIHCNYEYYIKECQDEHSMYSKFDKIVCVSSFTAEAFKRIMPEYKEKVIAIHNIFNEDDIKLKANEEIDDDRFDNSAFTLVSVGRVCDVKRFSKIPNIANQLKKIGLTFKWYIIGPIYQEEEFRSLENGIEIYNLKDYVIWLGLKANPYPYIKASDLYVCLSFSEACPMVFNEAKMLGTPIISTDFGSAFEFISDGENGFVCTIDEIPIKIREYFENMNIQHKLHNKLQECISPNPSIISSLRLLFDKNDIS